MTGLLYSFLLIAGVLALGLVLKKCHVSEMVVRKVVHMGVGNWWFIEMRYFDTLGMALVGPVAFIGLNTLFVVFHKGESEKSRNYGLVYYPIALLLLVLLQYGGKLTSAACLCGVLVMAYGDSLAGIFGKLWGKKKLPSYMKEKSWLGLSVMFLVSFVVSFLVLHSFRSALLVALVAAVSESATPFGLDNLSVPLLASWVAGALL